MSTRRPRIVPRPTSRTASRGGHDFRVGVPLIVLAIMLLGALIGTYAFLVSNRIDIDAETGCPASGPSGVTAILFDRTDPINDKQKLFLQNKLDAFRDTIQKFEEVDTYALEDQGDSVVRPLLRLCNPGKGTDVGSITGNPLIVQERWSKQFDAPLRSMMEAMREGGGSKTSAILEAIQSVSLQSFQKPRLATGAPRKLIIISDLIQFTKSLDFYKNDLNYQTFESSNEARRLHTNLAGVTVEILFIPRVKSDRINRLVSFWTNWLVDQGARKDSLKISWVEG
jgi:hypothetical protein